MCQASAPLEPRILNNHKMFISYQTTKADQLKSSFQWDRITRKPIDMHQANQPVINNQQGQRIDFSIKWIKQTNDYHTTDQQSNTTNYAAQALYTEFNKQPPAQS